MADIKKPRTYEPWGYREENNYISTESEIENDFDAFLVNASYSRDDNKIHFTNKDGDEKASIDVSDFVKSDSIVEKAWYEDGKIYIKFTNGDLITINVEEIIDQNEFADGLQVNEGIVSILLDPTTEKWLTVSTNGLKVSGIQAEIDRLDDRIDDEISRATGEEQRIEAKLDQEIADRIADVDAEETRAKAKEDEIEAALNAEITRSTNKDDDHDSQLNIADQRLDLLEVQLPAEIERAKAAEAALDAKIDQEIADREADVDAEQTRAEAAEANLQTAISDEETRATAAEQALDGKIDQEIADREADVDAEERRALSAETVLQASIEDEGRRAQDAEKDLDEKIDEAISAFTAGFQQEAAERESADNALQALIETEVEDRKTDTIASAEYDEDSDLIKFFNINDELVDTIDAKKFIKDGMIDSVSIETTGGTSYLVIVWNTDAGKNTTRIDIGDLFEADNYYTKVEIDDIIDDIDDDLAELDVKIDNSVSSLTASIAAEQTRATGVEALKANAADVYTKGEVDGKDAALQSGIDSNAAAIATKAEAADVYTKTEVDEIKDALLEGINVNANAILAERDRAISAETDLEVAVSGKADANTVYTQEEVDALIAEKEAEITQIKKDYNNLKEIVGEIGGNVEWGVPADGTFNNMMKKSGIVKLGEDTTTSTYTGGVTSKNKTTLHLNGKNLTFSGATKTNPAIMTRGKQELTIIGKGTFDADGRTAIEAGSVDTVINLSGTTGLFAAEPTYVTDKMEGELIYCYLGTINIYAGVFKNNGADKTFLLNCYDANYSAGTAKIVVYGGKFYDFDPSNAMSEPGGPISYLADGYHVETSTVIEDEVEHTVYTVKKD